MTEMSPASPPATASARTSAVDVRAIFLPVILTEPAFLPDLPEAFNFPFTETLPFVPADKTIFPPLTVAEPTSIMPFMLMTLSTASLAVCAEI